MYLEGMGLGRMLIILGIVLILVGLLFTVGERMPTRIGRLPGDIVIRGKNTTFYFPIVTSILLSLILTLLFAIFGRR
jgi:hypothetical protein